MKGIRGRLTANFMIVILVSVAILEVLLIYTVRQNYYGSLKGNLTNQVRISADMYSRYYSDTSLEDNILYNVDAFLESEQCPGGNRRPGRGDHHGFPRGDPRSGRTDGRYSECLK